MKNFLTFIVLYSVVSISLAGSTSYREISWLNVEDGSVYIKTTPSFSSDFCGSSSESSSILKIEKGSSGFNEMYSLALSSHMAGKKIRFFFSECTDSPWGVNVVKVYSSQIGQH
jgi:hypothetical protein